MAKETGWFRTEGGTVLEMDLPLAESIQQRVDQGAIVRVANADGDPLPEAEPEADAPPAKKGRTAR